MKLRIKAKPIDRYEQEETSGFNKFLELFHIRKKQVVDLEFLKREFLHTFFSRLKETEKGDGSFSLEGFLITGWIITPQDCRLIYRAGKPKTLILSYRNDLENNKEAKIRLDQLRKKLENLHYEFIERTETYS